MKRHVRARLLLACITSVCCIALICAEQAYPRGCLDQPKSFYDYESCTFPPEDVVVKSPDDYLLVRRLGAGKFSDVFEAVDVQASGKPMHMQADKLDDIDPKSLVVVKCLKPVSERKIKRELLVLKRVSTLPNLVRLKAIVVPSDYFDAQANRKEKLPIMPSIVLEHAGIESQWLCHSKQSSLSDREIRYFLFHLLVALDSLHAYGIVHRDVKPRNVLINRNAATASSEDGAPLTLIDLGLADFYLPGNKFNVRVASRHYKSPELLVGFEHYDYAIDMWSVGCILAGLLLRREPFFRGKDNMDQLGTIVAVLGTADLYTYLRKNNIPATDEIQEVIRNSTSRGGKKRDWSTLALSFLDGTGVEASPDGLDLVSKLLVYDHSERLTAKQAMQHRFFDSVREQVLQELGQLSGDSTTASTQ